jgi:hypothetical protein
MRMMMIVTIPTEVFNESVLDGTAGAKIERILAEIKPEAAYFTELAGERSGILFVDVKSPAQIPALSEPWFLTFEADVEFKIAMTAEDIKKSGLEKLGRKWA